MSFVPADVPVVPPWWSPWRRTLRYLMQTEAHVFALAISASVLLSFYPFLIVILAFCRDVLHSNAAVEAVYVALNDFLPGDLADFVRRNLAFRGNGQITSMFLLLFTANGVFEPLEVALNRAWGVAENRSYVKNQAVALGMIFLCGGLALLSVMFSAVNQPWIAEWAGSNTALLGPLNGLFFKLAAVPISILTLFLVYWLLPNRKVPPGRVVPVAIVVGLILEAFKYGSLLLFTLLRDKLQSEYGVFRNSATILIWSFLGALIVLAGAHWTARHDEADPLS